MKKRTHECTDQDFLVSMLIYAILETETKLRRPPTKEEILDHLFSKARSDPEARELERRLDRLLSSLLDEWAELDELEPIYQ